MPDRYVMSFRQELSGPEAVWSAVWRISSHIQDHYSGLGFWDGDPWNVTWNGQRLPLRTLHDVKQLVDELQPATFVVKWDHSIDHDANGSHHWTVFAVVRKKDSYVDVSYWGVDQLEVEREIRPIVNRLFGNGVRVSVQTPQPVDTNGEPADASVNRPASAVGTTLAGRAAASLRKHVVAYVWAVLAGITVIALAVWWRLQ